MGESLAKLMSITRLGYSEITNSSSELRNKDGSLVYSAANICIHFFTFDFLERVVNTNERALQLHVAKKKIPHVNQDGDLVKPTTPNGIKMEKFVFDVFRFANNFVVWECLRDEEFAPLKNAEGAKDCTPTYCRNALFALHQKWLKCAGVDLKNSEGDVILPMVSPASESNNNEEGNEDTCVLVCEISPLISYAGEGLCHYAEKKIVPPIYLE